MRPPTGVPTGVSIKPTISLSGEGQHQSATQLPQITFKRDSVQGGDPHHVLSSGLYIPCRPSIPGLNINRDKPVHPVPEEKEKERERDGWTPQYADCYTPYAAANDYASALSRRKHN